MRASGAVQGRCQRVDSGSTTADPEHPETGDIEESDDPT
jgi:hypothetical protein